MSADEALRIGMVNRVVPAAELDDATLALANEIAKNEPFVIATTKRAVNRVWDVAGFRAAMAANTELDVLIETANLPARDDFRRITQEQGLKAAIAWRDARFRGRGVSRSRSRRRPRYDLTPLLAPRSVAIVGASESPDSWAPEIERSLRHVGFEGELFPINPKYDDGVGAPQCLHAIAELPRGVDLVVFVVPARVVVRMIDDCGARGVRASWWSRRGSPRRARKGPPCKPSCVRPRSARASRCSARTSRAS